MFEILERICGDVRIFNEFAYFFLLLTCILLGLFTLVKMGDLLCDASAELAEELGVPSILVGLTIVSVATSAPELFTSISAIRSNADGLILGNIIGSNIANIGLVLGISLVIKPIDTTDSVPSLQRYLLVLITSVFSLYVLLHPLGTLTFTSGIISLAFVCWYLFYISKKAMKIRTNQVFKVASGKKTNSKKSILIHILIILLSTFGLWIGSDTLVFGSKFLATEVGIPEELIGFSIIAIGTSLPEMAASISLVRKNETSMLLGNIIGSNLFNIALVGGTAGILGPVSTNILHPWIDHLALMIFTMILFFWLKNRKLNRRAGIFLLAIYTFATASTWVFNM